MFLVWWYEGTRGHAKNCFKNPMFKNQTHPLTSVQVLLVPYCCLFCVISSDMLNVSIRRILLKDTWTNINVAIKKPLHPKFETVTQLITFQQLFNNSTHSKSIHEYHKYGLWEATHQFWCVCVRACVRVCVACKLEISEKRLVEEHRVVTRTQ